MKLTRPGQVMVSSSETENTEEEAICEDDANFRLGQDECGVPGGAVYQAVR